MLFRKVMSNHKVTTKLTMWNWKLYRSHMTIVYTSSFGKSLNNHNPQQATNANSGEGAESNFQTCHDIQNGQFTKKRGNMQRGIQTRKHCPFTGKKEMRKNCS